MWNKLPDHFKEAISLIHFKNKIREWTGRHVPVVYALKLFPFKEKKQICCNIFIVLAVVINISIIIYIFINLFIQTWNYCFYMLRSRFLLVRTCFMYDTMYVLTKC